MPTKACTESFRACEPSPFIGLQPNHAPHCLACSSDDIRPLCTQDGQSIDMQSGAASSAEKYRTITRFHGRSWQDSFDFQEFGFSYNIADVAPADELFYKGQILPLQTDTRLNVVQALSSCCMQEEPAGVPRAHAGRPSVVNRDDEARFNSCRIEGAMYDKATSSNIGMGAMRSLSFRSHHSGYWESGCEKDTTETSCSSSRDSSGSSQDSYFPNSSFKSHSNFEVKSSTISWKSFFGGLMKVSRRQHNPPLPIVAFSEDLSKYRPVADLSLSTVKSGLAPLMSDKDAELVRAGVKCKFTHNQCRFHGGLIGKPVLNDGSEKGAHTSKFSSETGVEDPKTNIKSGFRDKESQQSTSQFGKEGVNGATKARFQRFISKGRLKSKCVNTDASKAAKIAASKDPEGPKQRRWQGYARKLKPLYEVKKGLMGQFRMNECGKNATDVESGIVRRPSWQRKLSHQSSFFKNHKLSMAEHEENEVCSLSYTSGSNMQVAMSSCPPSTRSSPNHSGVLATVAGDNKAKLHQSGGNPNHNASAAIKKVGSHECISSMSTMHELHSAVQSAIAHCKESNRKSYLDSSFG